MHVIEHVPVAIGSGHLALAVHAAGDKVALIAHAGSAHVLAATVRYRVRRQRSLEGVAVLERESATCCHVIVKFTSEPPLAAGPYVGALSVLLSVHPLTFV